jgi:tetratricopeptide (TPR) repeat protein
LNEEAIHHYKEAIRLNANYNNAYLMLGNVYADLGELKKAYENYRTA